MISPEPGRCGVGDTTAMLLAELRHRVGVVHAVPAASFTAAMNDVDLIHVQHQYFLFGGVAPWKARFRALAVRFRAPAAMTAHEFVEPSGSPLRRLAIRLSNKLHFGHRGVAAILVHTDADRARMARNGISGGKVHVVRLGVPEDPDLPDRDMARRTLDVEGRFVVTVLGFLSRKKGHGVLLAALADLPDNVTVVFAGGKHSDDTTDYVPTLLRRIEATGVGDRVRVTGYLSETAMLTVLSATDLVAAPFTESSGSASLTLAFACGKPILASDIAPHKELAGETPGCLALFEAGTSDALAHEIAAIQRDSGRVQDLAAGSRAYAMSHSYGRMADETVAVYRTVLG